MRAEKDGNASKAETTAGAEAINEGSKFNTNKDVDSPGVVILLVPVPDRIPFALFPALLT